MKNMKERFVAMSKRSMAAPAIALLMASSAAGTLPAQNTSAQEKTANQVITVQGKFYCNIKALTPVERARHKELSEKLIAARKEIVETAKGYEFQFSPASVSLAELADWVTAESKCCPFFDFHIDLEKEGTLVCLRLTGSEGVKQFIRTEFGVQ